MWSLPLSLLRFWVTFTDLHMLKHLYHWDEASWMVVDELFDVLLNFTNSYSTKKENLKQVDKLLDT